METTVFSSRAWVSQRWNLWLLKKTLPWLIFAKPCWGTASEERWYLGFSIINLFFGSLSCCIFSDMSVFPWHALQRFVVSEAENRNLHLPYWHFNISLGCTSRRAEVSADTQDRWAQAATAALVLIATGPAKQLSNTPPRAPATHCRRYSCMLKLLMSRGWRECPKSSEYGNKRKFSHEPTCIPQAVFHSLQNTPSSCLIKWHQVSISAWLFSSLHHFEHCNLSNWCKELFFFQC